MDGKRSGLEEERSDGRRPDLAESVCRAEELTRFYNLQFSNML